MLHLKRSREKPKQLLMLKFLISNLIIKIKSAKGWTWTEGQSPSVSHPRFDVTLNNWQAPLCSGRKMRGRSRTHKKQPRKMIQNGTAEATSLTSRLKNHCSLQDKMHPLFMVHGRSEKKHKEGSLLLERVDR